MASLSLEWSRPSTWPNSWVAVHRRFVPWGLLSVNVSASSKWARPSSGMNAYASCPPGPSNRSGHLFPSPPLGGFYYQNWEQKAVHQVHRIDLGIFFRPHWVVSITKTEKRNLKLQCFMLSVKLTSTRCQLQTRNYWDISNVSVITCCFTLEF